MTDYQEGYFDAINDVDEWITLQIKRNGGGQTALQMINIFNGIIEYIHEQRMMLRDDMKGRNEATPDPKHDVVHGKVMSLEELFSYLNKETKF